MKVRIKITAAQMESMGWITDAQDESNDALELVVDNVDKTIELQSNGEVTLSDYTFDYSETLSDLADNDFLPGPPMFGNSAVYNDRETQTSKIVSISEINDILDMSQNELALYRTIEELNEDLCVVSFGAQDDTPEYDFENN